VLAIDKAEVAIENFFADDPRVSFFGIDGSLFGMNYYDLLFWARAPEDPETSLVVRVPAIARRLEEDDATDYVAEAAPRWRRIIYDALEYDRKKYCG
jgi:hypothetical protein